MLILIWFMVYTWLFCVSDLGHVVILYHCFLQFDFWFVVCWPICFRFIRLYWNSWILCVLHLWIEIWTPVLITLTMGLGFTSKNWIDSQLMEMRLNFVVIIILNLFIMDLDLTCLVSWLNFNSKSCSAHLHSSKFTTKYSWFDP